MKPEMLNLLSLCDITDMSAILTEIKTMTDRQYLNMHTQKVWQGRNGRFCTHMYVAGKRVLISKGTREELDNYIIQFYRDGCNCYTFGGVFYKWLSKKLEYNEIARNSYDRYLATFKKYFGTFKDINVKTVTDLQVEAFVKETIRDYELTSKGWNNVRIVLRGTLRYAKRHQLTTFSIDEFFDDLELPQRVFTRRNVKHEEQVFTDEEVAKIINYINQCNKIRTDYGILLGFATGMRVGEIITLRYSDMRKGLLNVARTEVRYKKDKIYVYAIKDATKGRDGRRTIPLTAEAISIIETLHEISGKDELFDTHAVALTNRLYRICDEIGIPRRSMHKCRKTYASMLIANGVSDASVSKLLGHTETTTTYRHYVFDNLEQQQENAIVNNVVKEWLKLQNKL